MDSAVVARDLRPLGSFFIAQKHAKSAYFSRDLKAPLLSMIEDPRKLGSEIAPRSTSGRGLQIGL